MIEVLQPGLLTTIQDLGRKGHEVYGIPPSGALDPFLASVANKLVGNELNAPVLEFALVGPTLKFLVPCWIAVAAFSSLYLANGKQVPEFSAVFVQEDTVLQFAGTRGWFGYLAVGGAFQAEQVLGSASACLSAHIGNRMEKGQRLNVGARTGRCCSIRKEYLGLQGSGIVHVLPGLHTSLFSEWERCKLVESEYTISMKSNRMGMYLNGAEIEPPPVKRSAPALPGTIQVPTSGQPIILGPEGPTTGGYAQIAVLSRASWTTIAETRPGEPFRFEWIDPQQALRIREYRDSIFRKQEAWEYCKDEG